MAKRVKTPTVLQMEAVECGAAALASVLGYFGRHVPLEELRIACGVSRDGSKASHILKAARRYGLEAKGFRKEPEALKEMPLPMIVHWNFNHFVVLEGFKNNKVYLNDPASGPRVVTFQEFDQSFTGVVLTFQPGPEFVRGGEKRNLASALRKRLSGSEQALAFIVLLGLALVFPGLVIPVFAKIFVDHILVDGMGDWLPALLWGMLLTALLRGLLTWMQQHYLLRLETKLALSSSSRFLWHVLRLPVEFFAQRYAGDIGFRVTLNNRVAQLLSGQLATYALNVVMVVFYFMMMMQYDVWLTLVGAAMALLNVIVLRLVSRRRAGQNQRLLLERGKLDGTAMGGLYMIETLKAEGAESDFFAKWAGRQANLLNAEQKLGVPTLLLSAVPNLLSSLTQMAILTLGGLFVLQGKLTMGSLVAFQSLMTSFMAPINGLVSLGGTLAEAYGDMNRLDDVYNYRLDPQTAAEETSAQREEEMPRQGGEKLGSKLSGAVALRNVTFGYNRLEAPLIENFNLTLRPGSRVALVGGSGSGKSTIAKLIAGLYEPWSGEILFDGKPRHAWPRSVLNHSLAAVDQDIRMFEGTVYDNLTLWDPTVSEADVIQAAKDSCIHDVIVARNGAYDSWVEEGGRNFSGGQLQRMEIARALATNPTVLILDEATSALDPVTERTIDRNIRRRGCTCIIIAHRLSTIRDCDEIIVLDKGKVVQRGTHEELKNEDGLYARLIRSG